MFTKIALAGAVLASLTLPGFASASQADRGVGDGWFILQDAGGAACYVANRMPGPDEARLSAGFDSEQQAQMALAGIAACQSVNIEHDKDSTQSNS